MNAQSDHIEQERHLAIADAALDSLPDSIVLLDKAGVIISANQAWKKSAVENCLTAADFYIGHNYLEVCDAVVGAEANDAYRAAQGIRSILSGHESLFAYEYPCHSPTGQFWAQMTATPLHGCAEGGAAVKHIDITARRRAELALIENSVLLRMVSRLGRIGAWSVDLSKDFVVWSDEICAIHEMPAGTVPSIKAAIAFYAPESIDRMRQAVRACVRDGTAYDFEAEITAVGGRRISVRTMGEAVRDSDGKIRRIQGALQDLTEQKRAERDTRELESRLANALESLTIGFYILDSDWRFTYCNGEAEHLLGRSRAELLGRNLWEAFPASVGSYVESQLRLSAGEKIALSFDVHDARLNRWLNVRLYPSDEGLAIYLRDVSTERAARQQLELLQASVSQLNDIVLITDAAPPGQPGPRIQFVNGAFERITGYTREEVLGQPPRLLRGVQTDPAEIERVNAALSRFEPVHTELLNYSKSGELRWMEMDIVPVAAEGREYTHFVATGRDVSERKRDQDSLREMNADLEARVRARTAELDQARELAEQASQAKSIFLATMSHEIRTPMNGVIGMLDVLHQTSLKGHQVEMLDVIRDSAFSLLAIIDDILDFSKIEAGKLNIEHAPTQVDEVVEKVCALLDDIAIKRGVRLTVFIDPAIPPAVLGDATRLRQVLVNLIGNAIKFSSGREKPGEVSVRAVLVERHSRAVTIDLIVADNGIGMDEAALASLFTPFSQADASTTRRFGGTGLGLAICSTLVSLMNGEILVRSAPGQGSTFTVRLHFDTIDRVDAIDTPSPVSGLRCRIIGIEQPLASDLTAQLRSAGAMVEYSPDLIAAADTAAPEGLSLWLILPSQQPVPDLAELRALAPSGPGVETRFIVLGRGKRRRPRLEAPDLVSVDADVLFRRTLFKALALATGQLREEAVDDGGNSERAPPPPKRNEARLQGRLILVAEDNETNRKVILRQLHLVGFAAEIVTNGREALEHWRSGDFALVLTDLHMPEMDGYALTAAIRSEEPAGRRTPIIALTANALRDEELRCREAGMDAYLTKPIRLPQLQAALEAWLGPSVQATPLLDKRRAGAAATAAVDLSVLTALVGDDPAVIREVLQAFRSSAGQSALELRAGVMAGTLPAVTAAAHKLKSGARSIGAQQLGELCAELEQAAETGRTDELRRLLPLFKADFDAVQQFVDSKLGDSQ